MVNPIYASQIQLELYEEEPKEFYVEYLINNKFIKKFPFKEFEKKIMKFSFSDEKFREWCKINGFRSQMKRRYKSKVKKDEIHDL